jgi:predicted CXXCH cytochrome family protein
VKAARRLLRGTWPWLLLLLWPTAARAAEFVGTTRCAECHAEQAAAWRGSHHDLAMRHATPAAVRGDFADATLEFGGTLNRFYRKGDEYWVRIAGEDGAPGDYRIDYTFGVEPLQQYMTTFADGRIQLIPFAWDSRAQEAGGQRWFHLYPQFTSARDEFFWTNRGQNWNFMCADCHSTNVRKGYDKASNRYTSTWSEINVGCEACHGPGSAHVAWAGTPERNPAEDEYAARHIGAAVSGWQPVAGKDTLQPAGTRLSDQLSVCAQCHSRRLQLHDGAPAPGAGFFDRHLPNLLDPGLYHADGQIDEEVFEYAPFLQSRMHGKGVVCSNCHEPHSARLRAPPEQLCAQCHVAARYASTAHHQHAPGSAGAACVACHMPQTTYMQVDARRDHGMRVPDPALAARIGAPDACGRCHQDKPTGWAAQALAARPAAAGEPFALAFAAAARNDPAAEGKLAWIAQDVAQPSMVRAAALQRLSRYAGQNAQVALARGARHADPLLKLGAISGSAALAPPARWQLLKPLLADPARAVRSEAVAALLPLWPQLPSDERAALATPLAEYRRIQEFNADRGFGRTNLGNVHRHLGETARAEAEYRGAIAIEPYFVPAWVNLADLLRESGRDAEGIAVLEQGLRTAPRSADLLHARGLAAVRAQDYEKGIAWLGEAVAAAPENARFRYVYGIALESRDIDAALGELQRAWELGHEPQVLFARCEVAARNRHASARACIAALRGVAPPAAIAQLEALLAP